MAETKKAESKKTLNIYQKLSKARLEFQKSGIKKTGINRHSEYKYFELTDIVPTATAILDKLGLLFVTTFPDGVPTGILYDVDSEETIIFNSDKSDDHLETITGKRIMLSIQETGAKETYQRRYLYMQMLDIVETDTIDKGTVEDNDDTSTSTSSNKKQTSAKKSTKPATTTEREAIKKELIDADGEATDVQIKSIKSGLKKLRDKDDKYEPYLKKCMKSVKAGISKKDAETMLIEIGEKIEE